MRRSTCEVQILVMYLRYSPSHALLISYYLYGLLEPWTMLQPPVVDDNFTSLPLRIIPKGA